MAKIEKKEKYDFGEKETERVNGKNIPVSFKTPKYNEAKKKAIELLDSKEYSGVLKESDFWILVNTYDNKSKAMYSGLILSHDGCLKINSALDEKLRFKSECVSLDKEGYKNSLVYTYNCPEQGIYEVGEISEKNCKNEYPYAMALKRCFDRVVLKNSKIAYSGIYSDSESDEFKEQEEHKITPNKSNETEKKDTDVKNTRNELIQFCKEKNIDMNEVAKRYKLNSNSTEEDFQLAMNYVSEEFLLDGAESGQAEVESAGDR